MKSVCIVDAHVVTAYGGGLDPLWDGLVSGRSAIAPVTRFRVDGYNPKIAACVDLAPAPPGESLLPQLLERLLSGLGPVPPDSRLLTATTKAGIDLIEGERRGLPADLGAILPDQLLAWVRGRYGLRDGGYNVNAACASSTLALARGASLIASGAADAVLVCSLDLVSEFVFSGFAALQALSSEPSRPFDRRRNGLSLGEGGAALLLMSEERARRDGRQSLATLLGWGVANDANHVTAPARDGCGLIQAVRQALGRAAVPPAAVVGISAHGTGTVYNDLMELTAFAAVFGERKLPLHSVKGAIGHTLGAAGGIEAALVTRMLAQGVMPPTVGCDEPEAGADGQVSATATSLPGGLLLSTNSGFGGINAALVLGKGEVL
ncbi:MAG TPA: beta-ketoacyl synthase [Desulfuromonas sp.]|nr:beta-ketoacyl synthase [Desulfuromonas sp.]